MLSGTALQPTRAAAATGGVQPFRSARATSCRASKRPSRNGDVPMRDLDPLPENWEPLQPGEPLFNRQPRASNDVDDWRDDWHREHSRPESPQPPAQGTVLSPASSRRSSLSTRTSNLDTVQQREVFDTLDIDAEPLTDEEDDLYYDDDEATLSYDEDSYSSGSGSSYDEDEEDYDRTPQSGTFRLGGTLMNSLPSPDGVGRPKVVDFAWAEDNYNERLRGIKIWAFILRARASLSALDIKWTYAGGYTEEKRHTRARELAVWVRESLLQLGPTFIKIGQLLSTRADLLSQEFVEELSELQDQVPSFSPEKAVAILELELGQSVRQLFSSFDIEPIAAASLGQVHRATLWNEQQVVVKIQRPGLKRLFDIDLATLREVAAFLDRDENSKSDIMGIYQECADVLYEEIDYLKEGRNFARFKRNFRGTDWVKVPSVEWALSSPQVLTLEYLPGTKITDLQGLREMRHDRTLIAERATEAYLTQILKHGFFHADPHPGNIAVDTDGALIFYDFGMVGEIKPGSRENLLEVFYGVYSKDSGRVLDALIRLDFIKVTNNDRTSLSRSIAYFVSNLAEKTERNETVGEIGEDLFALALDQPFRFPATFTFVLRSFTTLEGICKSLDPNYAFAAVATPYARELLELQVTPQTGAMVLQQARDSAMTLTQNAAAAPGRVEYLENTLRRMEDGDLKLRVRVLESERADRRQSVVSSSLANTIAVFGCLNLGQNFALSGMSGPAAGCMALASVFAVMLSRSVARVKNLDKFERDLRK